MFGQRNNKQGRHRPIDGPVTTLFCRLVGTEPHEVFAVVWSFLYFFCLLCSYYILRPLRDEMGIAGGVRNLQWVFTGTFVVMLAAVPVFGAAASRFPRHRLLPVVYSFFSASILVFFALFRAEVGHAAVARAFFIWVSVFNLFVVSVFWSFMADLFSTVQAKRLFAFIAAGGSAGAIVGPFLTAALAVRLGPVNLLPISAAFLGAAIVCINRLVQWAHGKGGGGQESTEDAVSARRSSKVDEGTERPMGGGILAGIRIAFRSPYLMGIGLFIWLYTTVSTFLYFEQAHIVSNAFDDPAERTRLFASIDLGVNVLTIALQTVITGRVIKWFGLTMTLALVPLLAVFGFIGLGVAPVLPVLVAFQVMRRAGNYGIMRPAREMLFTVVDREAKYKAKNFIDTVVYRAGDAISGWVFVGLKGLGLGLSGIAFIAVPVAAAWVATGVMLGKMQEKLRQASEEQRATGR